MHLSAQNALGTQRDTEVPQDLGYQGFRKNGTPISPHARILIVGAPNIHCADLSRFQGLTAEPERCALFFMDLPHG